jgi:hypothetical protein
MTATVMEMKHAQEHLRDTSPPPVVCREGSCGGGSWHGGMLHWAWMLPGLQVQLGNVWCIYVARRGGRHGITSGVIFLCLNGSGAVSLYACPRF